MRFTSSSDAWTADGSTEGGCGAVGSAVTGDFHATRPASAANLAPAMDGFTGRGDAVADLGEACGESAPSFLLRRCSRFGLLSPVLSGVGVDG